VGFHRVARAEEIPPGQTRFFVLGDTPVVLSNCEGRMYAHYGLCPHQGFPLDGASLWDDLLTCPWHNYQYRLDTGENFYPRRVYPADMQEEVARLRRFRVEVRDGEIWVDLEESSPGCLCRLGGSGSPSDRTER
jgi:nitrite reductase/ring-hydroxylating ferredoxin subunit